MLRTLVTGVSAGLGYGLAKAALENGDQVLGISRRECSLSIDRHECIDLSSLDKIEASMGKLLKDIPALDRVVLNAGQLGPIAKLRDQNLETMESLMTINLWSNKILVDWLLTNLDRVDQVVMISSGASINGNAGWGGYSLSKAALNMLVKLYASEEPGVHFSSLAPGLIDSQMQDYLCGIENLESFPSLGRLREAKGTSSMPSSEDAGKLLYEALPKLRMCPSGSYQDIRKL